MPVRSDPNTNSNTNGNSFKCEFSTFENILIETTLSSIEWRSSSYSALVHGVGRAERPHLINLGDCYRTCSTLTIRNLFSKLRLSSIDGISRYCCDKRLLLSCSSASTRRNQHKSATEYTIKMRGKRSKQYRKLMEQFSMTFGFREPYQVLGSSQTWRGCSQMPATDGSLLQWTRKWLKMRTSVPWT